MSDNRVPFNHPWPEDIIGNIGRVTVGGTPRTSVEEYWDGEIPWMASGDVHLRLVENVPGRITERGLKFSNATLVAPPTVAMGLAGQGKTRGTVALVVCELCTNQSVALITINSKKLKTTYLLYNLWFRYEELRSRSSGGGRAGLAKSIIEQVPVPLPTLTEQTKIAEILSTVDRAIEETSALIAKQQRIKNGLMQDLLTRGIDEHGNLRSEQTHKFKDSPLGRIPAEWEVRNLERCVNSNAPICYGILMPGTGVDGGIPVIKVKDIIGGRILLNNLLLTDPKIDNQYKRSRLRTEDLLITIRGTTGRIAEVPDELDGANITQDTARLRIKEECSNSYFYFLLQSKDIQDQVGLHSVGQAVKGINISEVKRISFSLPKLSEQEEISTRMSKSEQSLSIKTKQLSKLHLLKAALMQDLLTGKKRVTDLLK